MAFVTHGGDGEMDFARMRLGAGGNGVEPRLELREQAYEFLRRETGRRTTEQEIQDFASVKILVQVGLAWWLQERPQLRVVSFLCDRLQERTAWLRDLVTAEQRAAQRGFLAGRPGHGFFAVAAERANDFVDECRTVLRHHAERVSDFVGEVGTFKGNLEVPGVFGRAGGIELAVGDETGRERVGAAVTGRSNL